MKIESKNDIVLNALPYYSYPQLLWDETWTKPLLVGHPDFMNLVLYQRKNNKKCNRTADSILDILGVNDSIDELLLPTTKLLFFPKEKILKLFKNICQCYYEVKRITSLTQNEKKKAIILLEGSGDVSDEIKSYSVMLVNVFRSYTSEETFDRLSSLKSSEEVGFNLLCMLLDRYHSKYFFKLLMMKFPFGLVEIINMADQSSKNNYVLIESSLLGLSNLGTEKK